MNTVLQVPNVPMRSHALMNTVLQVPNVPMRSHALMSVKDIEHTISYTLYRYSNSVIRAWPQ